MKPKANTLSKAGKELELSSEKEKWGKRLKSIGNFIYIYILVFKLIAISLIIITFKNYPY